MSGAAGGHDARPTDVGLVIVAHRRAGALDAFLESLAGQIDEVVVVNVTAHPEVGDVARRHGAALIETTDNVGYGRAVNLGARALATGFVVFSNDDVVARPDAVSALVEPLRAGRADVVVPALFDEHGQRRLSIAPNPTVGRLLLEWALLPDMPIGGVHLAGVQKWRRPHRAELVPGASGAVVGTTRELLLGEPIPEVYFMYWEEREWFWRLEARGASVLYQPASEFVHRGGAEILSAEKERLMALNAVRAVRRTHGSLSAGLGWLIVMLWQLRLMSVSLVRTVTSRAAAGELSARSAGLRGACEGLSLLGRRRE